MQEHLGVRHFVIFIALLASIASTTAGAATIVRFDFDDGAGGFLNLPNTVAGNVIASAWSDLDGTLTDTVGSPGRAVVARDFANGNAFMFLLTIRSGYRLALDGFRFDERASASGPKTWRLAVAGSPQAEGVSATDFATRSGKLDVADIAGSVLVTLSGAGASSGAGTWRVDNFALTGNVSLLPLPGAMWMLATTLPLVGPALRRRRQIWHAPGRTGWSSGCA